MECGAPLGVPTPDVDEAVLVMRPRTRPPPTKSVRPRTTRITPIAPKISTCSLKPLVTAKYPSTASRITPTTRATAPREDRAGGWKLFILGEPPMMRKRVC